MYAVHDLFCIIARLPRLGIIAHLCLGHGVTTQRSGIYWFKTELEPVLVF